VQAIAIVRGGDMGSITAILDHGSVELIEVWGSDERIIEAARMSTGKGFQGWEKDAKLLAYLYKHRHMTPFEMCGAVFEIKAPIFVFREWHRHRTQSYNEMSARYIPLPDENYVPSKDDVIERSRKALESKNKQARSLGERAIDPDQAEVWLEMLEDVYERAQKVYDIGIQLGVPKELARLPVTVGRYSKMRASANLRNWLQFLDLRTAPTAQQEIRLYANTVQSLLEDNFPRTMDLWRNTAWRLDEHR
jgi:thymidylate synthase (FAD)